MKHIFLVAFFLVGVLAYGQADPVVRSVRYNNVTTAEMNAIPAAKRQIGSTVFNTDTNTKWIFYNGVWNDTGVGGGTDDQTATEVPFTSYSTIAATNVQNAIQELLDEGSSFNLVQDLSPELGNNLSLNGFDIPVSPSVQSALDAQDAASEITFSPYGSIGALNVQSAIQEILDEGGSGGSDGYISNVALVANSLSFTGALSAFSGSVSLAAFLDNTDSQSATQVPVSPAVNSNTNVQAVLEDHESRIDGLAAGGADGVITNVSFATTSLTFTGSGGGFNGSVNLAGLQDGIGTDDQTAAEVTIQDNGNIITATTVEGALQENRTAINLNTAKVTNATHTGDVTGSTVLEIAANAVGTTEINNSAVTGDKISAAAITNTKIADNAVTTTKIADENITNGKLANNAVNGAKILNNTITWEDLAQFNGVSPQNMNVSTNENPAPIGFILRVSNTNPNEDFTWSAPGDLAISTTNFNGNLSATENSIQEAFDALDDLVVGGGGTDSQTLSITGTGSNQLTISGGNTVTLPVLETTNQFVPQDITRDVITGLNAKFRLQDSSGRTYFGVESNQFSSQSAGRGTISEGINFIENLGDTANEMTFTFDFESASDVALIATPTDLTYGGTSLLGDGGGSGGIQSTTAGLTGALVVDNIVRGTEANIATWATDAERIDICTDCAPAKVVSSSTLDAGGFVMYNDQSIDAGTLTLTNAKPGGTVVVYINRASAPTLAGSGLTFNQLPDTAAFAAATQMALYMQVSYDGTTIDYYYYER